MSTPSDQLSAAEHDLLNTCIAWHVRPHRQVFLEGLTTISAALRFDDLSVLELGATARSTVSPFLVARGAQATATCYAESELPRLDKALSLLAQRYGLARDRLRARRADIFALDRAARFDLVVLKDVLGGVNRRHDQAEFRKAAGNCLAIVNPNGHLLIVDKAHSLGVIHLVLRTLGSAGRNKWHYFTREELEQLIPGEHFESVFAARGILSFGDFGGGMVQRVADCLDERYLEWIVPAEKRVVFSLVCGPRTFSAHGARTVPTRNR